ncbi:AHH domain-containing protein [Corallococcus interemptor]|uniref:AHH domain-containing protein n=2 Tax=Corallococcus interemptor TaxID=2316720 RepID=UPI0035D4BD1E
MADAVWARGAMTPRWWVPLLLTLLLGCSTSTKAVRLDTGRGEVLVDAPSTDAEPVDLDDEEFVEVVQKMGRDVPVSDHPREAALRLLAQSSRPRAYSQVRARLGLISATDSRRGRLVPREESAEGAELSSAYTRWCKRKGSSGDCLHLLKGGLTLGEEARRTIAFQIALDSVWDETAEALKELTDRDAVVAMLATTGAVYFGLWLLPEPVSKGVAAVLTVGLIAYLGWDTVWSLIQGFSALAAQARVAASFDELRDAGEQYGKVMGKNAARVFIMLATAALGSTAQTLASKIPTLPGSAQAALVGANQGGFQLAAVGQVEAVAVSSGGVVTIALAPEAVAMTARGTSAAASGAVTADVHEHHIATNKWWESTASDGPWSPRFQKFFDQAGMSLDDAANRVPIKGHKGPHPKEYHETVYERLRDAMEDCGTMHQCREALTKALRELAEEISTSGTKLNKLVTKS